MAFSSFYICYEGIKSSFAARPEIALNSPRGNSSALLDRINRIDRKIFFILLIPQFRSLIL